MDGETLLMLASHGSIEQMKACGLKTVRQQMDLKKLISSAVNYHDESSSFNSSSLSTTKFNVDDRKLSRKAMQEMTKEEKYIYLIK